jgi:hypothetical protein
MNYSVTYKPSAERELADIWTRSSDRTAIADAANRLDRKLGRDPYVNSEARDGNIRIQFEYPLAVRLEVSESDRVVEVLQVYRIDLHK